MQHFRFERAPLLLLKDRKHIAGRILEPGYVWTFFAEHPLLVLDKAVVALEVRPTGGERDDASSMSSTSKFRIVQRAGVTLYALVVVNMRWLMSVVSIAKAVQCRRAKSRIRRWTGPPSSPRPSWVLRLRP